MINIMEQDRFGTPGCPRAAHAEWVLAEFGGGFGVIMRQRASRLVKPVAQPTFTAAPRTYLNDVVPPSAALHERSP